MMEPAEAVYEVLGLGALRTRLQVTAQRGLSRFVGPRLSPASLKVFADTDLKQAAALLPRDIQLLHHSGVKHRAHSSGLIFQFEVVDPKRSLMELRSILCARLGRPSVADVATGPQLFARPWRLSPLIPNRL